ncbi:MAG: AAA family ATPase [Thermoguttaceae bacterium]
MKLIFRTLQEGADEYLDESRINTELTGALVRFRAKNSLLPESAQTGRVVAVLAPSGGSGASTLAVNIGISLAQQYKECGLIDLRLSAGDLASMLNLKPIHTLVDLCDNLERLDQRMFDQFFVRHGSGVSLLAAPHEFSHIKRITDKGVRRTLSMARVRFPYVVVDLDNAFSNEQIEALWLSDVIMLVLRLDYTAVRNTRRVLENLKQLGIGHDRVRIVANGYWQSKQLKVVQAEEALGMKIVHLIPQDPASVNQAVNKGIPALLSQPSAKFSKSVRKLIASLNGHCPRK